MVTLLKILAQAKQLFLQNGEQKMLNILTKTMPWMVASVIVATSGFGQSNCCPPPKPQCCKPVTCCPPVCPIQLIPAYNHPAGIETRCSWDVWVDASFTYWQAIQDNMEVGIADSESFTLPVIDGAEADYGLFLTNGHVIDMGFKFKPGFKVGAGVKFDYDDWDAHAEYTWFRSKVHVHSNGPETNADQVGMIFPIVGAPSQNGPEVETGETFTTITSSAEVYSNVSSKWKCNMDIIDATMGRWYYVGTKLQFHPYSGARAQWIRQNFNTTYTNTNIFIADLDQTFSIKQRSHSWAIGPEVGLDMNWMMGQGFRLFSCVEADVLYTRYTKLRDTEQFHNPLDLTVPPVFKVTQRKVGRLRSHVDFEMGMGWGTYLDCNNWYLDLSAEYGFQVFFDQNMFRKFVTTEMLGNSFVPNGNLYIHGLTATVALHF